MEDKQVKIHNSNYKITEKDIIEYVLDKFQETKKSNTIKKLITFQATNKYMIMVHDQEEVKNLGRIVASYKKIQISDMLEEYEKHLKISMMNKPTIKTHINVIMHIFGHFSNHLNQNEKELFFVWLEQLRENKITIGNMLLKINPAIYRLNNTYLASQTYFLLYSDIQFKIRF